MPKGYFLSVSNGRTGSTHFVTSLNELPGVITDYEIKWKPQYEPQPVHEVMREDGWSCKSFLDSLSPDADLIGSKLVFDFHPVERGDVDTILKLIEDDIAIVHITRNYFDIILSQEARGPVNALNRAPRDTSRDSAMLQAVVEGTEKISSAGGTLTRKPRFSFEEQQLIAVSMFQNDLICRAIAAKAGKSMHVDYLDLNDALSEIAAFVGYTGPVDAITEVQNSPVTRKLPDLDENFLPEPRKLREFCNGLYERLAFLRELDVPLEDVWREDGRISVPGLG